MERRCKQSGSLLFSSATVPLSVMLLLLLFLMNSGLAEAFPFSKASGVVELTPATLNQFVSTHKPVYVLFYAPWCGHCRKIHPEWEKFAQAVQGTIRVGAVNADAHKELGQQFSIRGFPTIKYWNVGEKRLNKALEYEGPRQASSLQAKAMSLITSTNVKKILNSDALREAVQNAPEKKAAVLFSSKSHVPPIFSVLSYSPRLKSMPFYFVGSQAKAGLALEFGVQQLPSIVVLNATDGDIQKVAYPEKQISYEPIAKFLLACATDTLDEYRTGKGKDERVSEATGGGNSSSSGSKLALPVRPVRLTADALESFCSPKMHKNGEKAPLCVVSLTSAFKLDSVHELFRNEPLLFFEAHADRDMLIAALEEKIGLGAVATALKGEKPHDVLLLRAPKRDTVRYALLDEVKTADSLNAVLQKVVAGELPLAKKVVS
ncbi:putative thioredoxin [Trypanosoma grayi]|uniref:putative thioredoxin n=1 Tax=Trypanosoma grayi TaxID=71804 RepID=UPI0004F48E74|nr:putative thioredoxin [Trypanosoma grayi]KEG06549.1 putative thioredoxin [Trypanosoma grayi]